MIIIAAVEDRGGMEFHHRRVSRDRILTEKVRKITTGKILRVDPCSKDLFPEAEAGADFLDVAEKDDICFVENRPLKTYLGRITKIILFRWNRRYPADLYFDLPMEPFQTTYIEEFPGYSHKKITMEIWERR